MGRLTGTKIVNKIMIIPLIYNDGGRSNSSFQNEHNDCAVRSLAIAFDLKYDHAHKLLQDFGRKTRHKTYNAEFFFQFKLQCLFPNKTEFSFCHIVLSKFVKQFPIGTFIVHKQGHLFTIKNGIIHDIFPNGGKSRITWFVRIK